MNKRTTYQKQKQKKGMPRSKPKGATHAVTPLEWMPALAVLILVIATILTYSLYLTAFGSEAFGPDRDLVMSRVLSTACDEPFIATFVPNVATLGFGTGFGLLAVVFYLKHIVDREYKLQLSNALVVIAMLSLFTLLWMLAFPTGRGSPWDLFHQITAGVGVAGFLLYVILDAWWMATRFKLYKKLISIALSITGVAMAITFVLEMEALGSIAPANLFASFQFAYMGVFYVYILFLSSKVFFTKS